MTNYNVERQPGIMRSLKNNNKDNAYWVRECPLPCIVCTFCLNTEKIVLLKS